MLHLLTNYNLKQKYNIYSGIFIRGPALGITSPDPSLAASVSLACEEISKSPSSSSSS